MDFHCESCNYTATNKYNFGVHNKSKKHLTKIGALVKYPKRYICEHCNKESTSAGNLLKHVRICKEKIFENKKIRDEIELSKQKQQLNEENKLLKQKLDEENKLLKQQLDEERQKVINKDQEMLLFLKKQLEDKNKTIEEKNKSIEEKNKSIEEKNKFIDTLITNKDDKQEKKVEEKQEPINLEQIKPEPIKQTHPIIHGGVTYCRKNFTEAEPIEALDYETVYSQEDRFEEYLLYKYKEKQLISFFGDGLISEYAKEDPQEQSVWCSDTSRSSYILREMGARKPKWISDKNGYKFKTTIIKPILQETKTIISKFSKSVTLDDCKGDHSKYSEIQQDCLKLGKYLDSVELPNSVLKYIAPKFQLDMNNDECDQ